MGEYLTRFREGLHQDVTDSATMGGKASHLLEMSAAGFPVPEGFVLSTDAYRAFLETNGLEAELREIVDVDTDDPEAVATAAAEAKALITDSALPEEISTPIRAACRDLEYETVAVRSSATAEDLADASFAGQQETFLGVRSADEVVSRVQHCWASLFTERAITYRADTDFPIEDLAIAVVVQRMAPATTSGVLFTVDPNDGSDRVIVEAALGLGEAVVSGETSPDNYVLDKASGDLLSKTVNDQQHMCVIDDDEGEVTMTEVSDAKRSEQVLDAETLEELVTVGNEIEAYYESPQDVEWALADGQVYVSRPDPSRVSSLWRTR
jgi:pyruvate,water dikinase